MAPQTATDGTAPKTSRVQLRKQAILLPFWEQVWTAFTLTESKSTPMAYTHPSAHLSLCVWWHTSTDVLCNLLLFMTVLLPNITHFAAFVPSRCCKSVFHTLFLTLGGVETQATSSR